MPVHVQGDEVDRGSNASPRASSAEHLVSPRAAATRSWWARSRSPSSTRPGHTPGSQCFLVNDGPPGRRRHPLPRRLRAHRPARFSDPEQPCTCRLTQRLAKVGDDVVLYPGHLYSEKPSATMAETRSRNVVFRPDTLEQWMMMFAS